VQDAINRIGHVSDGLQHESFVGNRCGTDDVNTPTRELDDEERVIRDQPTRRPDPGGEEVGRSHGWPVGHQEGIHVEGRSGVGDTPAFSKILAIVARTTR
jgi:hypothetical protein